MWAALFFDLVQSLAIAVGSSLLTAAYIAHRLFHRKEDTQEWSQHK